jgi:hypothetical protein
MQSYLGNAAVTHYSVSAHATVLSSDVADWTCSVPHVNLTVDGVLSTTRAVRRRLDLARPVEPAVIAECFALTK